MESITKDKKLDKMNNLKIKLTTESNEGDLTDNPIVFLSYEEYKRLKDMEQEVNDKGVFIWYECDMFISGHHIYSKEEREQELLRAIKRSEIKTRGLIEDLNMMRVHWSVKDFKRWQKEAK